MWPSVVQRAMGERRLLSNDNQRPTRAELEAANRELRASLKRCEALVSDCRDKLVEAHGLSQPDRQAGDAATSIDIEAAGLGGKRALPPD
jgi:hypothetical protein